MTLKERIEAFVLNQGNQVGAGAELAAILNDIVDAIPAGQVQSDWNQANNTEPDYIKNKPTIPAAYTLPPASAEVLGGVKVGDGLKAAADGTLTLKAVVITETLSGSPREISSERYGEIIESPVLLYDGKIYLVGPDIAGAAYQDMTYYSIFVNWVSYSGGVVDSFEAIICYFSAGDNAYFIRTLNA